ncbi:MAG: SDR family NAD(P)-dependent oxidoreductase [Acidimicrobiaceae bacterium]|nr:SDR family NAD(P)-dependent oxidoreductase [Acidimicrobiaceae bacterium]
MTSVLITGTSSGIGLACAAAMSGRGWTVFASMRDLGRRGPLDAAVSGSAGTVHVVQLDVTDEHSVRAAVAEVLGRSEGRLDAVVHNAGIPAPGFFAAAGVDALRATIETNVLGTASLTEALLPAMREAGRGRVVVVSSVAAFVASPGLSAYTASKWALEGWCESLAVELAPLGIDVVLVEPGMFETRIWQSDVAEPTDELYARWTAAMRRRSGRQRRRDPAVVGERIARIVASPRPHFRNPVGVDGWLLWGASKLVPYPARARIVGLVTGAPRAKR